MAQTVGTGHFQHYVLRRQGGINCSGARVRNPLALDYTDERPHTAVRGIAQYTGWLWWPELYFCAKLETWSFLW